MNDWKWIVVFVALGAGCAGGELDGMDAGRFNPDGNPDEYEDAGGGAGDARIERDAGAGADARMDVDVDSPDMSETTTDDPREHCLLDDASVAHLGSHAAAIDGDGRLRVVVGGDAVRLFTRKTGADWTQRIVSPLGDAPSVASAGETLAVAWVERFGPTPAGEARIRLATLTGGVWDDAVTVAEIPSAPGHDTLVDVAIDEDGEPWLAWFQESDVGQVLRVAHFDAGAWDVDTIEHGFRYVRPALEARGGDVIVGMGAPTRLAVVERHNGEWGAIEELEPEKARSSDDLVVTSGNPGFAVSFEPHPSWGIVDEEGTEVMRCDAASNGHPLGTTVLDDGSVTSIRSIYDGPGSYRLAMTDGCEETPIDGTSFRLPPVHTLVGGLGGSKVAALQKGSYAAVDGDRLFVHVDQGSGSVRAVWSRDGGNQWEVDDLLDFRNFGYAPAVATAQGRTLIASVELGAQRVWVSEFTDQGWQSQPLDLGECRATEAEEGTVDVAIGPERAFVAVAAKCPESFLRVTPKVFAEDQNGFSEMPAIDYDRVGDLLLDLAVTAEGQPAVVFSDGFDEYRHEFDGTEWRRFSISSLGSSGEARPRLEYAGGRRATVVSVFGSLDVWLHDGESSDRVGVDHPSGAVAYDVELGSDGIARLAHATQDDEVVTVRYVEIEQQGASAAVVTDEFVAAFTSLEPVQGLDLRVTDQATEILVAPGDGRPLRHLVREGSSWSDDLVGVGEDTAWFPRFAGEQVVYHDRARGDLCTTGL